MDVGGILDDYRADGDVLGAPTVNANAEMIKARAISGFPEWLPEEKWIEENVIDAIRRVYRSYGYTPLETAAVELTEVVAAKGVDQKELYSLVRFHADEAEMSKKELSLHFDLTVPFARFVAANQSQLTFPLKRYQIQKVWRGERPKQGRFREFYQCDIDVVGIEKLPLQYDIEILEVMSQVFDELDIGKIQFRLNHRKLIEGFYRSIGIEDADVFAKLLIEVDKLDKIGREALSGILKDQFSLSEEKVERILRFGDTRADASQLKSVLAEMGVDDELFKEGAEELQQIMDACDFGSKSVSYIWDGSITRGLNYYTGMVVESILEGAEDFGSVCSGGRYDGLTRLFSKTNMPGVGISIGLTRLLAYLFAKGDLKDKYPASPTDLLLVVIDEARRSELGALARRLRSECSLAVELSPAGKVKKQMAYANKKGASKVLIPNDDGSFELKDMGSGEQQTINEDELIPRLK